MNERLDDDFDEDWYDDDSEADDDSEPGRCPECGGAVHELADRCPACGYWITESDRRAMGSGSSKPLWLRVTAVVVLVAFLMSLLGIAAAVF